MKKVLLCLQALIVLVGLLYFPTRWVYEWKAKNDHYHAVSDYVRELDQKVAHYAYDLAVKHKSLPGDERVEIYARLDNLDKQRGSIVLLSSPDQDTYSKVLDFTLECVRWNCMGEVTRKTGLDINNQNDGFYRHLRVALRPFADVFEMNGILSQLAWNRSGVIFENLSDYEYSMESLAKDRAEYAKLRQRMGKLLAKAGVK